MIHIAICDDSSEFITIIENYFIQLNLKCLDYDVFLNGNDILKELTQDRIHNIYILDIEMSPINGIDLARNIRNYTKDALIIFITSYSSYVYEVFDVVTFDFIIKPISYERFSCVINKALDYIEHTNKIFYFSYRKKKYSIFYGHIAYFEKKGRILYIHSINHTYQCNMPIKELIKQLDSNIFVQIHSSYIVNLSFIQSINKEEIQLTTGEVIYASRDKKQYLKEKHLEFIKRRF